MLSAIEIKEVGVKHNQALEHVLAGFNKYRMQDVNTLDKIQPILNLELDAYYKITFEGKDFHEASSYSKKEVNKYIELTI